MDVINSKILLNLDYPDIINACQALPAFARVCDDPYFWALKAEYDFGIPQDELQLVPGSSNLERYKFIYDIKDPNTGLVEAASLGTLALVRYFLKLGADLHAMDEEALYLAADNGHLDVVKYLVELGADNEYALKLVARDGHLDIVKYLVEQGADIHARDEDALRSAAMNGHLDVVKYLVELGANIHARNEEALVVAAGNGHLDVVEYLVELGANLHIIGEYPLRLAAGNGHLDVVKYLVELGANSQVILNDANKYKTEIVDYIRNLYQG